MPQKDTYDLMKSTMNEYQNACNCQKNVVIKQSETQNKPHTRF